MMEQARVALRNEATLWAQDADFKGSEGARDLPKR
jgi:hypothetical protein